MKKFFATEFGSIFHADSLKYMPALKDGEINLIMISPLANGHQLVTEN